MPFMNGFDCFFEGMKLVRQPGLRQYVIMPLSINILVLSAIMVFVYTNYGQWIAPLLAWVPDWLSILSGLIEVLAAIGIFTLALYGFSVIANIISSPFNAV